MQLLASIWASTETNGVCFMVSNVSITTWGNSKALVSWCVITWKPQDPMISEKQSCPTSLDETIILIPYLISWLYYNPNVIPVPMTALSVSCKVRSHLQFDCLWSHNVYLALNYQQLCKCKLYANLVKITTEKSHTPPDALYKCSWYPWSPNNRLDALPSSGLWPSQPVKIKTLLLCQISVSMCLVSEIWP